MRCTPAILLNAEREILQGVAEMRMNRQGALSRDFQVVRSGRSGALLNCECVCKAIFNLLCMILWLLGKTRYRPIFCVFEVLRF